MANRDRLKAVAVQQSGKTSVGQDMTLREAALLGVTGEKSSERPYVNLKYYWPDHECISVWQNATLKAFSSFCRKLAQMRWAEIYAQGGAVGHKSGLAYTVHKNRDVLPNHPELAEISPDLTWFELRVDGEARVHGFRVKDAFFLVFLDHEHKIYPN